jgi:hypothetical protein
MRRILSAIKARLFGSKQKPQAERRRKSRDKRSPVIGEYVVYRHLRMKVTPTHSNDLWKWLVQHGWRVADFKNDRRSYVLLPDNAYAKFDLAATTERPMMIRAYLRQK